MVTFNQVRNIPDPALQSRWRVRMPGAQELECIAESVQVIFRGVGAVARHGQAKVVYYPDTSEIDALNIVFYETHDYKVTDYLHKWRLQVRKPNGDYGLPVEYERTIVIELLAHEDDSVVKTFEYEGAWPTDPSPIELSYEDPAGRIQITAQFRVSDVKTS